MKLDSGKIKSKDDFLKLRRGEIKPKAEFELSRKYKSEIGSFTKKPKKLENFKYLVTIEQKFSETSS